MSPYLKITGRMITMWIVAALCNGLICGITLLFIGGGFLNVIPGIIFLFFVTLIFSIPAFFIFWITLLFFVATHVRERALFRAALVSAFIISIPAAYFGKEVCDFEFGKYSAIVFCAIVLSAALSVLMHFKYFKKIT